jgi:protein-tyrosine phosphatase
VILRRALELEGLADAVEVGSAGPSWAVEGMPMDDRTELALERAGYPRPFEHTARTIHLTELLAWDLVLAMTPEHAQTMRRMADQAPEGSPPPRIEMWRRFEAGAEQLAETDLVVEDPWYEGQAAFDRTVKQMELAVPGILTTVREVLAAR